MDPTPNEEARRRGRRAFLGKLVGRTAYAAPAILALHAARPLQAGGVSCRPVGSPCTADADCCAGLMCLAQPPFQTPCMGGMGMVMGMSCECG